MGRLGIKSLEEYKEVIDLTKVIPIWYSKVYTHFANADEPGDQWIITMNNLKP